MTNQTIIDALERVYEHGLDVGHAREHVTKDSVMTDCLTKIKKIIEEEMPDERVASMVLGCPYCKRNFAVDEEEYNVALREVRANLNKVMGE